MKRMTLTLVLILFGGVHLALGDVVTLTDNTKFSNIAVDSISLAPNAAIFLARQLQGVTPVGEDRPLDTARTWKIEFRAPNDSNPRPRGRSASMIMANGNHFDTVWVESCERTPTGAFTFQVRQDKVPAGGKAYAVQSTELTSLVFRPFALSFPSASSATPRAAGRPSLPPSLPAAQLSAPAAKAGMKPANPQPGMPSRVAAAPVASSPSASATNSPSAAATPEREASAGANPFAAQSNAQPTASVPGGAEVQNAAKGNETASPSSMKPAPAGPKSAVLRPGEVTQALLQKRITVKGKVINYRASWATRAPNIVTIEDQGKSLDAVYWDDVSKSLGEAGASMAKIGTLVQVTGDLEQYRGSFQLRINSPTDIRILATPQNAAPQSPPLPQAPPAK